jgi:hypothetical protein
VLKEEYAGAPALTFATDGADGALSVTITNNGNQPLTAVSPGLSVAADFMQVEGAGTPPDCTANFSLEANISCNLSVEFEPVAPASGTVNGSVTLTDNNLNATPSATQTILLVGTATASDTVTHYSISAPAAEVSSGPEFPITIMALDAGNQLVAGYNGTADLTSSDPGVGFFPSSTVTFTNGTAQADMGVRTAGTQTVTATSTANPSIAGMTSILVTPGSTARFIVSAPPTATSGTAFNFTVIAVDLIGNTTHAYTGTVQFTSTDGSAVLPANSTLTNGIGVFSATLNTAGSQSIVATDTVTGSITGAFGIEVSKPSTITTLVLSAGTVAKGTAVTLTATVAAGGNPVTNGIVSFYEEIGSELVSLGDAQIVAANANSAALKYIFGPGTTAIVAKFHAAASLPGSESTAQAITVTGLDATTTAIASSGSVGNYALTGTVAAFGVPAPQGRVSFEDQSSGNTILSAVSLDSATLTNGFAPQRNYAVGINPYGVRTADLNGDGIPDLAVANQNSANVSVLLGNGDGTFAAAVSYPAGAGPSWVVIGDFNRDGIPDLAVTNYTDNTVSILLGDGNGTFQPQQTFPTGSLPISVAIGDFNGDGIPDLAVANYSAGPGSVSILLGKGDGTFQPQQQTFAAGDAPYGIAVVDLENNGTQDLIVADSGSGDISVLLGNGDGTFQPQVPYLASGAPNSVWGVTVGDFNGDGFPDVAAATATNVSVWLGTGSGTLNTAVGFNAGDTPYAIAAHDLFGNGKLDLAVVNVNGNNVSILAGNGNGTFASPVDYATTPVPQALTVGDFNGDGRPDLAVVTGGGSNANIFLGEQTESATATGVSVPGPGEQNIFASYPGSINYASSVSSTIPLTGSQASQTITFPAPASPVTYGVGPITLTATSTSGLPVTYTVTGPATVSGSTLTITGAGAVAITASQGGNGSDQPAPPITQIITVNKATPALSWPAPAAIVYGTALSSAQLDASATGVGGAGLPGSFTYNPLAGAVPAVGSQSLQVSFTPADTTDYTTATTSVTLAVATAGLQVTANNATKVYGTANPAFTGAVSGGLTGASFTESFTTTATTSSPAGSYAIVPSVMGATVADYAQTVTDGTLTVTKAGSTTTVSASSSSASPGQTVTLTAAVISQTSETPTGTVTFFDNGVQLGTAVSVLNGTATLAAPVLSAGATAVITAAYSGDTNFLASTSSNSLSVVVASPSFSFTSTGPAAYTAAPGAVATYNFALSPLNGSYPGNVSFSITGLPTGATASFTPNSVTASGGATPVTMTVQTASATAQNRNLPFGRGFVMALLFLPLLGTRRVREKLKGRMLLLILVMAGVTATLSGCGTTNGFLLQKPQTYTLTVTATGGTVQNRQAVTLIVQ